MNEDRILYWVLLSVCQTELLYSNRIRALDEAESTLGPGLGLQGQV